jgi:purine-binding chemotaxis protein CheW
VSSPTPAQALDQYLTFTVADDEYAVDILKVREIVELGAVTKVPSTPPWIRGVINLRGAVVPLIDLAVKFGLPPTPATKRTAIVVVELALAGRATVMGAVVDGVRQVLELSADQVEPPPSFGTRVRVEFLRGLAEAGGKFILLLDIDAVLSVDELLMAEEAAQEASPGDGAP